MTDVPFSVLTIVAIYLSLLMVLCVANYAAGTLRHDEDQAEELR